jgi:L-idonate 5-dehydrogenase
MISEMRAAVLHGARDIRIEQIVRPELMPGMVLLRSRRVGICGSDLHYFEEGKCAAFVPNQPFVLGHEVTAEVMELADGAGSLKAGDRVTVNPARNCGFCEYCGTGRPNLCRKTIMLGSASTTPPTNGALADFVVVRADQCHALPGAIDDSLGAMMEPFAVALQAVKRAGVISGRRVLVTGAGTIGQLVAITARAFGAVPVAISDIVAARRENAVALGADCALDPLQPELTARVSELTGDGFDVIFEASGSPRALRSAFDLVRPSGTIVQIGTLGTEDIAIPANLLMNREINFVGSMRYGNVFDEAIRLAATGRVDLRPLISGVFALERSTEAFEQAADKSQSFKIQIEL